MRKRRRGERVAREEWPHWAEWVALSRTTDDVGVGSTVKRMLGTAGVAWTLAWKLLKVDCGCVDRQKRWDAQYPY